MATTIGIPSIQIEIKTVPLTVKLLKQMDTDTPNHGIREYLPGGSLAKDEDHTILGWVHGSVLEAGEEYWCWLIVLLRRGEYVRCRVSREDLRRWAEKFDWMKTVKQLYL